MAIGDLAGWVALAATSIAAVMTASNLGARVTGWGFVVFAVGAVAWIVVGVTTNQQTLLLSNAFLLIIDGVGVWRWLGRRAKFDDAAQAAEAASVHAPGDALFAVSGIEGKPITDRTGKTVAYAVDALTACTDGAIAFLIVRMGGVIGVGEELRRLPWARARMTDAGIATDLAEHDFDRLPIAPAAA